MKLIYYTVNFTYVLFFLKHLDGVKHKKPKYTCYIHLCAILAT